MDLLQHLGITPSGAPPRLTRQVNLQLIANGLAPVNGAFEEIAESQGLLDQFRELFHQEEGESDAFLVLHREFLSDNVVRLLREAHQRALDHQRQVVTPMDLLISMFTTPHSIVAECFEKIGVTAAKLTELAVMAEVAAATAERPL